MEDKTFEHPLPFLRDAVVDVYHEREWRQDGSITEQESSEEAERPDRKVDQELISKMKEHQ